MANTQQTTLIKRIVTTLPGILLALTIAIISSLLQYLPIQPFTLPSGTHPIEAMSIALIVGILFGNSIKLSPRFDAGLHVSMRSLLSLGIVLLGFRLNLHVLANFSIMLVVTIISASLVAFISACIIGRLMRVPADSALLIAIGNAICGSSAIAAISPLTNASKDQIAIAIAIVNLLGLISVFLFPFIAHLFSMNATKLGIWAGATVQAVPQAIACGFTFNQTAGNIATLVKLARVLLLGPYVVAIKLLSVIQRDNNHTPVNFTVKTLLSFFPMFIILFFIVVVINTYLPLNAMKLWHTSLDINYLLTETSALLLTMALAAIGIQTNLYLLIKKSRHYLVLGFLSTLLASAVTLLLLVI